MRSINYLWGSREALDILSCANPLTDENSRLYSIEILGGIVTLGPFLHFAKETIAAFHVIANTTEEAIEYIEELCNFAAPDCMELLRCCEEMIEDIDFTKHRGVIRAYPFSRME